MFDVDIKDKTDQKIELYEFYFSDSCYLRAVRRHHRKRVILKRYKRVRMGHWFVKNPGHLSKNNTICSCWMCGNPRKYLGEKTIQEKRLLGEGETINGYSIHY